MNIKIFDLNINYLQKGTGDNIILIHGWGQNINYFQELINELSKNYTVYALDLPGFGLSDTPEVFKTNDYSAIVEEFIKQLKIKSPTIIGHSFGGKVILDLITKRNYHPKKIILIDSSGIKTRKKLTTYLKIYTYKLLKFFIKIRYQNNIIKINQALTNYRQKYASHDYIHTVGTMRETFLNVLKDSYNKDISTIKCPVLLLWGELDLETPLKQAKYLARKIQDAGLVIIKGANHFPFLTNFKECQIIIESFLN